MGDELKGAIYEKAKTKQFEKYRAISLYTLLATQIKYDVTGIAVSPEFWLQMKLNDYSVSKSEIGIQDKVKGDSHGSFQISIRIFPNRRSAPSHRTTCSGV